MKLIIEHQDGTLAEIETECVKLTGDNLTLSVIARVLKQEDKLPSGRSLYMGTLWPHKTDAPPLDGQERNPPSFPKGKSKK